jgi:endonuclease/exonuclease/phosphatase family metal-dependent hydrolase
MAGPLRRAQRRTAGAVACLVAVAALLTGSPAAGTMGTPFRVLQLNICDSGIAHCYTGRSVPAAAAVIRAEVPDVVTLNEVCEADVEALGAALAGVYHGGRVARAFAAAVDRRTGGPYRCRNGQAYGIGLVARLPAGHPGYGTSSGIYAVQDTRDPEERAWLCVTANFYACTTHLASTSRVKALAQCRYLLDTAIPAVRARHGYGPTVLGADFNLHDGGSPDVRSCLPPSYLRVGDGGVQHVMATDDFRLRGSRSIGMRGTTDHPALLIALTLAGHVPADARHRGA